MDSSLVYRISSSFVVRVLYYVFLFAPPDLQAEGIPVAYGNMGQLVHGRERIRVSTLVPKRS